MIYEKEQDFKEALLSGDIVSVTPSKFVCTQCFLCFAKGDIQPG